MYSAADLIDAVQRKLRVTARRSHPVGEFPPGWQAWFASMRGHVAVVTGATAEAMVAVFLQRPLATAPPRLASMSRWQAFSSVWRQQWHGLASAHEQRDQRGQRWLAGAMSAVVHLFLGVFMLWLLFAPVRIARPPPQGETVVQVEYIGDGTPEEIGGGPAPQTREPVESVPVEQQVADAAAESVPPELPPAPRIAELTAPATPELDTPIPPVVPRDVPTPPTPAPPAEQPLTVTESIPDTPDAFVLPPTTARTPQPAVRTPELTAAIPSVRQATVPEPFRPPAATPRVVRPEVAAPVLRPRTPDVVRREIPTPLPRPVVRVPTPAPVAAPAPRSTVPEVRRATLPNPATAPATAAAQPAAPPASTARATPAPSAATASASTPRPPAATASGSGPRPTPAPGSWPTPSRADDWGDATRNRPGAQRGERPGLFNSDGSARLAETPGSASPAQPPGTITDEITDLDRSGTWLKRKPTDYQPTAFDQFWRPNETLLEEWVRRSVTTVRIPIPGTNKHVVCQTVMLALGGGCGISDPNLNEQPATARPPPDIPFKPHLQEDNGSVRPAGG